MMEDNDVNSVIVRPSATVALLVVSILYLLVAGKFPSSNVF